MHSSYAILSLFLPLLAYSSPLSPESANAGAASVSRPDVIAMAPEAVGKPQSEGKTTFDGAMLESIPQKPSTAAIVSAALDRSAWTVTCDSFQPGTECSKAIDGNNNTLWHTHWTPDTAALPHSITVDMQQSFLIQRLTYEPRQDGNSNGNIGQHVIAISTDGVTFTTIATGTYIDDKSLKMTIFTPINARYVRVTALTEAGGRGPWTSMAELNIFSGVAAPPPPNVAGSWGLTIDFPVVPVSAAIEATTGRLLVWSSYSASSFGGSNGKMTITSFYNPASQKVTERVITNTGHDMFCVGLSMNANGQAVAVGGNTDSATSIYDSVSDSWTAGGRLKIGRGYQAQVTLSDGRLFTIGASWAGGSGGKNGEIYDPNSNTWSALPGAPVAPMLTNDAHGVYRADNHGWIFGWKQGSVFQAGPSKAMNWYGTGGTGSQKGAGSRGDDSDSMCGDAIMFDAVAGKILTAGGSPSYSNTPASTNAHIITLGAPNTTPTVKKVPSMTFPRAFGNGVVLPDGTVLVVGGQATPVPFTDTDSQLTPELFDPKTNTWTKMAPISMPRNYHSTALLMLDGTVMSGGGGLCGGCATNHYDAQLWSPPYLYNSAGGLATRPVINNVSAAKFKVGTTLTVNTDSAVLSFSLIRMASTTHTVNTDQRRIPLTPTAAGANTYKITIPNDSGVAIPGYWMLFALNAAGTPSKGKTVQVTN